MPAYTGSAPDAAGHARRDGAARLMIAGLGHHGLGLAAEALDAGFHVTCIGPAPWRIRRLIDDLAADDALAATLQAGLRAGALEYSTAPNGSVADVAVLAPADGPDPSGQPGPLELAVVALAPGLSSRTHVVVVGRYGLQRSCDLVAGIIGLLTGWEAGPGYLLGFALPPVNPGAPTVVSGVDAASVSRTEALFSGLGHRTVAVIPPAAAEFVAHLQSALIDMDRCRNTDSS